MSIGHSLSEAEILEEALQFDGVSDKAPSVGRAPSGLGLGLRWGRRAATQPVELDEARKRQN